MGVIWPIVVWLFVGGSAQFDAWDISVVTTGPGLGRRQVATVHFHSDESRKLDMGMLEVGDLITETLEFYGYRWCSEFVRAELVPGRGHGSGAVYLRPRWFIGKPSPAGEGGRYTRVSVWRAGANATYLLNISFGDFERRRACLPTSNSRVGDHELIIIDQWPNPWPERQPQE